MKAKETRKIIREILAEMGVQSDEQANGDITAIADIVVEDRPVPFIIVILTAENKAFVQFFFRGLDMDSLNSEKLKEVFREINSNDSFKENGERWMKIGLTAEPTQIIIGCLIEIGKTKEKLRELIRRRMVTFLENIKTNWPKLREIGV